MGFLSKLFGKKKEEQGFGFDQSYHLNESSRNLQAEEASWGDKMPSVENQYNYPGSYEEYFEDIFQRDFASYQVEKEAVVNGRTGVYSFWSGDEKVLVVELLSQASSRYMHRQLCREAGIAYLRFYYDHHGWWNTRDYVVGRIQDKLNS